MSQAIFTTFFIIGMVIVVPTGVSNAGSWEGGPPYKTDSRAMMEDWGTIKKNRQIRISSYFHGLLKS